MPRVGRGMTVERVMSGSGKNGENKSVPFPRIACDRTTGLVVRLAGMEVPVNDDKEKTLAELKGRIAKTIAYLQTFKPAQIDGTEDKETRYTGRQFMLNNAAPNTPMSSMTRYANSASRASVPVDASTGVSSPPRTARIAMAIALWSTAKAMPRIVTAVMNAKPAVLDSTW